MPKPQKTLSEETRNLGGCKIQRILFSIGDIEDILFSIDKKTTSKYCVSFTIEETWNKKHCVDTAYGKETNQVLTELGLVEAEGMDGCFEAVGWDDRKVLQDTLEQVGFTPNEEFDKWLDGV